MKRFSMFLSPVLAISAIQAGAAQPGPTDLFENANSPVVLETQCILEKTKETRRRLSVAVFENRHNSIAAEARLDDIEARLFSTVLQSNSVDTNEAFLQRLRTALPEFASRCSSVKK